MSVLVLPWQRQQYLISETFHQTIEFESRFLFSFEFEFLSVLSDLENLKFIA